MSRKQTAKVLQLSPNTVKRLEREGWLPPVRIGARVVRYREADVIALIQSGTLPPAPAT